MARGISLHIGVNECDPDHYFGWADSALSSCENDADTMEKLARRQGFETRQLKTAEATRDAVIGAVRDAASQLSAGDLFLVSYSGHGGQVRDYSGDEADELDDTWCLYDGQLLDDELHVLFAEFKPGVRVLMLSDSCHSGTMLRGEVEGHEETETVEDDFIHPRAMPRSAAMATGRKNRTFYRDIQRSLPNPPPEIRASLRLLSGCHEHELSYGNAVTGRFTAAIKKVFDDGNFEGDYEAFHQRLIEEVAKARNPQTPGHMVEGANSEAYDRESPFKI